MEQGIIDSWEIEANRRDAEANAQRVAENARKAEENARKAAEKAARNAKKAEQDAKKPGKKGKAKKAEPSESALGAGAGTATVGVGEAKPAPKPAPKPTAAPKPAPKPTAAPKPAPVPSASSYTPSQIGVSYKEFLFTAYQHTLETLSQTEYEKIIGRTPETSEFPEEQLVAALRAKHGDNYYKLSGYCTDNFKPLADELQVHIASKKYSEVLKQLHRCIAGRIRAHKKIVSASVGGRNFKGDDAHLTIILLLRGMYKFIKQKIDEGYDEIVSIQFIPVGTGTVFPYGRFIIEYKPIMVATSAKPSAGENNGSAWTGGKRKTRRVGKSKRKQTRRRR